MPWLSSVCRDQVMSPRTQQLRMSTSGWPQRPKSYVLHVQRLGKGLSQSNCDWKPQLWKASVPTTNCFSSITELPGTRAEKAGGARGVDQAEDEGVRAQSVQAGTHEPRWRARGDWEERGALTCMGLETPLRCAGPLVTAPACHARNTEAQADDIKRLLTLSGLIQAVNEGAPGCLLSHVFNGDARDTSWAECHSHPDPDFYQNFDTVTLYKMVLKLKQTKTKQNKGRL